MAGKALALLLLACQTAQAAPGALLSEATGEVAPHVDVPVESLPPRPTPSEVWNAVGIQLVKQHVLLAMQHLRVAFAQDDAGVWLLHLTNTETDCHASRTVGRYDVMTEEHARSLAFEVMALMQSSGCGVLPVREAPPPLHSARVAPWVRPVGALYATTSALVLWGISTTEPPNLSLSFSHAPSAFITSGLMLGAGGGIATLLVPDEAARPLLETTVASSMALQVFAAAGVPERGVPAYGEYVAATGYAVSSVLLGVDWALSSRMNPRPLDAARRSERGRAISPLIAYAPAVLGAAVSLSRALSPSMGASDREMTLGFGAYELLPAATGLTLGWLSSRHHPEKEAPEPWIAGGPRGSLGLTLGGSL